MIRQKSAAERPGTAACILAVLVLLAAAFRPAHAQGADTSSLSRPAHNLNPLSSLDPETLDAFKSRPLFAPSRRRPPPRHALVTAPPPVAVEAPPPDLRLVGIVSGVDHAVAILRRSSGGPSLSLKIGDAVESWHVDTIGPDRVTLRNGSRESIYRLFAAGRSNAIGPRSANLPPVGIPPPR